MLGENSKQEFINQYSGNSHEFYLALALVLAEKGEASTFPNPMVGCIITYEQSIPDLKDALSNQLQLISIAAAKSIVGFGYHQVFGQAHAEVNAINSAKDFYEKHKDKLGSQEEFFANCTIYISLEPCCHQGKTPACTELIKETGIKNIVFAIEDANPEVAGKGAQSLRDHGCNVEISQDQNIINKSRYLNRAFYNWLNKKPWISLKIAVTKDGRMVTKPTEPRWISNSNSRKLVHRLRSTHQLIITGIQTVLKDNPQMSVRHNADELDLYKIKQPKRVILKSENEFSKEQRNGLAIFEDIANPCMEFTIKKDKGDYDNLQEFIKAMQNQGLSKIMIEAGPKLSQAFLKENLLNEIIHFEPIEGELEDTVEKIVDRYINQGFLGDYFKRHNINKLENLNFEIIPANTSSEQNDLCLKILL